MAMVFCRGCGREIEDTATRCPHCGAAQSVVIHVGEMPEGVKGWSWGAFFLSWIWAIGNRTWIGLLALIPWFGFIMAVILGIKGREWAWKNRDWKNLEHFNRVQRNWSIWGFVVFLMLIVLGVVSTLATFNLYEQMPQPVRIEVQQSA